MILRGLFVIFFSCFYVVAIEAQDFSALWNSHFSYFNIVDITRGDSKIYAAAENVIFSYDVNSNEIETITTVEGLSGDLISTIEYSQTNQLLLIGYSTGLVEIYFEADRSILTVVDILEKQSIDPTTKTINDFYEHENLAYIATDFGISIYNLDRLEFGDTYFIGNNNTQIPVEKITVANEAIYAACNSGNGIKKGLLSNPNLIDAQQWQTLATGSFTSIESVENKVYTLSTDRVLSEIINDNIIAVLTFPILPLDSNVTDNQLIYTTPNTVYVYNAEANLVAQVNQTTDFTTRYTSALTFGQDIYVGTNSFGVLKTNNVNLQSFEEIRPNGPLLNSPFKLQAFRNGLWVSFGEYDPSFNPFPLNSRGISVLQDQDWTNIPAAEVLGTRDLNAISINPLNTNQVFISSFFDGILEVNDLVPATLFNTTNSSLNSLIIPGSPNYLDIRVGDTEFDRDGNLWSITSRVDNALNVYNPTSGQWQSYSFQSIIVDALNDERAFTDLEVDNVSGTKWIGSVFNGLIGYNETLSNPIKKIDSEDAGLLPNIFALALDKSGHLWIGTSSGLRVLFNTSRFFEDENVMAEPIIFIENGLARELLESQTISDIEVDGSNNKWISTVSSGVFYFTPDGQTTIYHFTKDNSPLPSNAINDISIDESNGTVYFATPNGLVSFRAGGSAPLEELTDAYVYPNPIRPEYNILGSPDLNDINKGVKIVGLTENVNVKITDIEGNLVAEAQSRINRRNSNISNNFAIDGGTGIWNGKNLANNIVASGVYLIIISDLDTFESKILKLLIIR
jgi:hypothetical protein